MDLYSLCNKIKRGRFNINKSKAKRNAENNDITFNFKNK